jgi:UDP-glucose 4-epimerase
MTLDNLSMGYRDAVKYGDFIEGDIADSELLDQVFESRI